MPAMADRLAVPFALPDIGQTEVDAVVDVLRSRWLTSGEQCRLFEEEFAAAVGARYAVAVNSCTAALHLSLEAFGVGPGDLVFVSPYTFAASAEVVRYLGATPVFVDIDPDTLNISVTRLREAVELAVATGRGRPLAVIPVHIAGVPCDMEELWDLARQFDLAVVEDAAHAFPSAYQGRPVGSIPDDVRGTACFSFYATKTITTGEGGMLTTQDEMVADRARSMSLHGLSRQAWGRYTSGGSWAYDIVDAGFKYNLTDIAAAMGRAQLARAEAMTERRREIARTYTAAFEDCAWLQTPTVPMTSTSAWHLYILRVGSGASPLPRDQLIDDLKRDGIGTSVHFIPLHLHSYYVKTFGYEPEDFPVALREYQRALSLPIYSAMSDEDVDAVVTAVRARGKDGR
jgi:dTDP-4-amino-4,6-dideoxygalactose transaminase